MRQTNPVIAETESKSDLPIQLGGHLVCLDGLRGIAIFMVMMCHYAGDYRQSSHPLFALLRFGSAGVDLFFVLSGFLITGLLFDLKSSSRYLRNFYFRRMLRIFPLYYSVLLAVFVILPLFSISAEPKLQGREILFWFFASNWVQASVGSVAMGDFAHFWSLAIEEHFYLLWPFVIRACNRKQAIWACLGCMAVSVISRTIVVNTLDPVFARNAVNYWTPCRIEALALGGLIALIARGPSARLMLTRLVSIIGPVMAGVLFCLVYQRTEFFSLSTAMVVMRSSLCAWVSGAALIAALLSPAESLVGRFLSSPFLRVFGKYSYALYVFHFLMLPVFERVCPIDQVSNWAGSEFVGRFAFLAVMMTGSWCMALLSWNLIEKPFLSLKSVWAPNTVQLKIFQGEMDQQPELRRRAG